MKISASFLFLFSFTVSEFRLHKREGKCPIFFFVWSFYATYDTTHSLSMSSWNDLIRNETISLKIGHMSQQSTKNKVLLTWNFEICNQFLNKLKTNSFMPGVPCIDPHIV